MNVFRGSDQIADLYAFLDRAHTELMTESGSIRNFLAYIDRELLELVSPLNPQQLIHPQLDDLRERLHASSHDFQEVSYRLATDLGDARSYFSNILQMSQETASPLDVAGVAVAAATIGPFVTAFCTELGKRFGGSVADWTARMKFRSGTGDPGKSDLRVEVDGAVIVIELNKGLPDEARLALLDLDIESPAVRGHRLRWDREMQAWIPTKLES